MDKTYEIFRGGSLTTFKIKDHNYDVVEFTITKAVKDDDGKEIVNSGYTTFFSGKEFRDFFEPIINDMKVRFDNENQNR
jgi:hypothetical protein